MNPDTGTNTRQQRILFFTVTGILTLLFFLGNIAVGSVMIPAKEIFRYLFTGEIDQQTWQTILVKVRLPQAVSATLAGSGLAVGGLMMQTLFRNPLAGPSILGISSGASLGVAFVMMFIGGTTLPFAFDLTGITHIATMGGAFIGSFLVLLLILFFARQVNDNAMLLIIGIMVGYISSSLVGVLKFYGLNETVHSYALWGLGSFSNVTLQQLNFFMPAVLIGIALSLLLMKSLNVLLLGEHYAKNLGLNVRMVRFILILCTGLVTAVITAFCGPIAFLGMAVPHIAKILLKTSNHHVLMPAVIILGPLLALICNMVASIPGYQGTLPINAVTSMIGAPIVISVILQRRKLKLFT